MLAETVQSPVVVFVGDEIDRVLKVNGFVVIAVQKHLDVGEATHAEYAVDLFRKPQSH